MATPLEQYTPVPTKNGVREERAREREKGICKVCVGNEKEEIVKMHNSREFAFDSNSIQEKMKEKEENLCE